MVEAETILSEVGGETLKDSKVCPRGEGGVRRCTIQYGRSSRNGQQQSNAERAVGVRLHTGCRSQRRRTGVEKRGCETSPWHEEVKRVWVVRGTLRDGWPVSMRVSHARPNLARGWAGMRFAGRGEHGCRQQAKAACLRLVSLSPFCRSGTQRCAARAWTPLKVAR